MTIFLQFVFRFFRDSQEKKSTVTLADFEIVSWWDWNYLKKTKGRVSVWTQTTAILHHRKSS